MTPTTASSFFADAFAVLTDHLRSARTSRAQRLALRTLMDMDAHQLDDLGLSVGDIVDALQSPPPAGPRLEDCRAVRGATWKPSAPSILSY